MNNLLKFFTNYYQYSRKIVEISKYFGERFDLVQAGGGNISFKINDYIFIKSSGCNLTDIEINKNYVGVNYKNIKKSIQTINSNNKKNREKISKKIVDNEVTYLKNYKPSIETTMHTLTRNFTVHLHPIQFNTISNKSNCESIIEKHFTNYCFIDYCTPGIDVALEINKKYNNEEIIFLKNHGIVVSTDNIDELFSKVNDVVFKLEIINYFKGVRVENSIKSL